VLITLAGCARHTLPTIVATWPPETRASQDEIDAFAEALKQREPALKQCHEAVAAILPKRVHLYITMGVDKNGQMTDVRVVSATVDAPEFFNCLVGVVQSITLAPREADTGADYIVYPFSFAT
jgi:hypothetical protein